MIVFIKILGTIFLISGFFLVIRPNLFGHFSAPVDAYHMIEKRVKWGMLIGAGLFLIVNNNWTSWGILTSGFLTALTLGIIIARLIGFVLDGFFIKQIWWLSIEFFALLLFGFLYLRQINYF